MNQRRAIVLAAIVILLGLSVVVTESGALAYLPKGWWLRFLQPLSGLLFAIAVSCRGGITNLQTTFF